MKANIVCNSCGMIMGNIENKLIAEYDVERYQGCFKCDCGGDASLVIQPEE